MSRVLLLSDVRWISSVWLLDCQRGWPPIWRHCLLLRALASSRRPSASSAAVARPLCWCADSFWICHQDAARFVVGARIGTAVFFRVSRHGSWQRTKQDALAVASCGRCFAVTVGRIGCGLGRSASSSHLGRKCLALAPTPRARTRIGSRSGAAQCFFSLILFQMGAVVFALVTGSHSLQGGNPLLWIVPHLTLQLVPCVAESH